jgi:Mg-chelatase subunit ChlD
VPLVGLIVDAGVLYVSKARLQAAVDGAALAAARSLNLGQTTSAQAANAQRNAVNWFYADFPNGNWSTSGTVMSTASVQVYDDASNPNLRHVDLNASTRVPTYFMKWFNVAATTIQATGHATRRDSVIMLVLDRSGSMCQPSASPCTSQGACGTMKAAAKLFTGQFAAGRDYIGLVSFSDGTYVSSAPTRNFQTVLGYTSGASSGTGAIDNIQCQGGTNSAQAISVGYNELYRVNLPGALNVLVFESDGLPNALTMNMWDGAAFGLANLGSSTGCQDTNNRRVGSSPAGWTTYANRRYWQGSSSTAAYSMNTGGTGFMADIPGGAVGALVTSDPSASQTFWALAQPFHPNATTANNWMTTTNAPGCGFATSTSTLTDFAWLPATDVFGNSVNPANAYKTGITMNGSHLKFDSSMTLSAKWNNFWKASLNAADNAAYRARSNATLPATVFVVGLGGQGADPPDYTLMQRIANDPLGDQYNTPTRYNACSSNPTCVNYANQPQGRFIFSSDSTKLKQAFLTLSSQILRLSR